MDRTKTAGLRHDWKFQYPRAEVLQAARDKVAWHEMRLGYWQGEFAKAVEHLKAGGLEIRQRPVTGGVDVEAIIDPERRAWLAKCQAKIAAHRAGREEYARFGRALAKDPGPVTMELDADDVSFFFGPVEADE